MRPAPIPNDDDTGTIEDQYVADPLADSTNALWNDTAKRNRDIFTEIFRPVPTNLVRSWAQYDVSIHSTYSGLHRLTWQCRTTSRRS